MQLESADGLLLPPWQPGQYITVQILIGNRIQMRSYSLATTGETLRILVKKVDNGAVSRFLLDHAPVGTQLFLYPPKGSFSLRPAWNGRPLLLLGAGSGIAPLLTLASHTARILPGSAIHLHHAARTQGELYFHDLFTQLKEEGRISYSSYISSRNRRITPGILQDYILPSLGHPASECAFMLCGPYVWMRSLRIVLTFLGVDPEHILVEQFSAPNQPFVQIEQDFPGPCQAIVHTQTGDRPFPIHLGQTVLEAAESAGLHLPYSCRGGVCGSCAARLTHGRTAMRRNEILSDKDVAQGLFLTCTALPLTPELALQLS